MKQQVRHHNQRGASLIEVTIALLVGSIGLLSVAQLFAVTTVLSCRGRNNTEVARAAQRAYESLRASNFSGAALNATGGGPAAVAYTPGAHNGTFNVTTQITDVTLSLKRIAVTVVENNPAVSAGARNRATFISYRTDIAQGQYFAADLDPSSP